MLEQLLLQPTTSAQPGTSSTGARQNTQMVPAQTPVIFIADSDVEDEFSRLFESVTPATIPSTTPLQAPLPPPPHYGGKNLNLIRTEEEAMFSPESQDILPPNTQKKQRDQQPQQHQASYTQQQQQQQHSVHLEQQQQRQLPPSNFEEFRNNSVEWLRALLGRHEGGSGAGIGTIGGGAE
ncbi:AT-rich binding protein-like [Photinus pyralis]|uniref:AT-rich binding protein-like n=1 Tax=Photinus pyralis TaxID=7054 RepID=UPI0012670D08|nr:AT-rich binding protein-like [Photinus pyralis]